MKTRSKFNEDAGVAVHECLATMKVIRSLLRWEILSGEFVLPVEMDHMELRVSKVEVAADTFA